MAPCVPGEAEPRQARQALPGQAHHSSRLFQMDIPTLGKLKNLFRRLNNSAPGPAGTPYTAWKRIPSAAQLLLEVTIETMKGFPVPLGIDGSLMIFTPKGSDT
eukprot:251380-Pyramimonas_sp.AAC.1